MFIVAEIYQLSEESPSFIFTRNVCCNSTYALTLKKKGVGEDRLFHDG